MVKNPSLDRIDSPIAKLVDDRVDFKKPSLFPDLNMHHASG